ncbi:gliding motility-associated C-terminal domain-containing protein [Marinoscillum sp.]|uniref:T9SS type B sorting domain-containing protein n=1 Tax=Marinoscillum sp. TaxID=2024838 RepID=UPI003BA9EC31
MKNSTVNPFVIKIACWLILFGLGIGSVHATHIRAGEITARRINNLTLTYEFTFTGYRDSGSVIHFGDGIFRFGDSEIQERGFNIVETPIDNEIEMVQFKVVHTYQAANSYVVSYEEKFRNEGIINMDNSVNTTFYVESMIVIDPFFGLNNTPVLLVPPIDFAAVGARFIHNPGAFDPDGDSLSYKFVTPKQARGAEVNNYRVMNAPEFYSIPNQGNEALNDFAKLTMDPVRGDLEWDAPGDLLNQGDVAEYNVAFVIEEWRQVAGQWFKLGYVTRDMQIIVKKTDNERPELEVPEDLCVEAGETVSEIIQGTDPDGQQVKLEAYGGPFEVNGTSATYQPDPATFQGPPGFLSFEWETECGHVRVRPYEVQFKVTDKPDVGPRLVNFETLLITVVGPSPKGLESSIQTGKSIRLKWDKYNCVNAESMQIWRRVGEFEIEADDCNVGMPANSGYRLIDEIPMLDPVSQDPITEYLDNNEGKGLAPGAKYCYRLVATFPLPGGGESYVSEEVCDSIVIDAPAITNVDVLTTSETEGRILVRWAPPYQIDQVLYPPDYKYDVFRAEGLNPAATKPYQLIASGITDTVFTDIGLNTFANAYHYFVRFYDAGGVLVDSSATASSVRLALRPLLKSIELNWAASVPWSNTVQDYPYHYIYRDQVLSGDLDQMVLIDSVDVTSAGFYYLDNGNFNDEVLGEDIEYCYAVTAQGSYFNPLLPEPLINRSQIGCGQPNDTIPPCAPPVVTIADQLDCASILASQPCGSNNYTQKLSWTSDEDPDCDDDISFYNVYFTSSGREEDYAIIATPSDTRYDHMDLSSLKGCYRISAVDRSGNESELTEEICNDNCPVYKLPNVFTPNNDGINDVFSPLYKKGLNIANFNDADCPRFVLQVDFRVFDRSGSELYAYNSFENPEGIYINWDGKNKWGQELPAGVYYYVAEVTVDVLNPKDTKWTLNGWLQILK